MTTIYAIHGTDPDKLAQVIDEMRSLGAPTIEVVDCGDYMQALEGSHRLAAASALGLMPAMIIHEQGETLDVTGYDWFDEANWSGQEYTAGEVAGELFSAAPSGAL